MKKLSKIVFALVGIGLMLSALALMIYGPASLVMSLMAGEPFEDHIFHAIGFLIVAAAVFDVSKYILEEEAISDDERKTAAVTRRSLTRFVSTIVIAVLLEGLVLTFELARENIENTVYSIGLMLAGVLLLVGLGVYQRLSAAVEEVVDEVDPEAPKRPSRRSAETRPRG